MAKGWTRVRFKFNNSRSAVLKVQTRDIVTGKLRDSIPSGVRAYKCKTLKDKLVYVNVGLVDLVEVLEDIDE